MKFHEIDKIIDNFFQFTNNFRPKIEINLNQKDPFSTLLSKKKKKLIRFSPNYMISVLLVFQL